jgi:hypothetical protein
MPERMQSILRWVYIWMGFGLFTTAIVSFVTASNEVLSGLILGNPAIMFGAIILQLVLVVALSFGIRKMSPELATGLFFFYAVLNGFTFSVIFVVYSLGSIFTAFLTTAVMFGAMTVYAFTTKTDLTKYSTFFFMALIGLIAATLLNLLLRSSALDFIISVAGVLIFTALTAYDTQRIRAMAAEMNASAPDQATDRKVSIIGALMLYLDFINLFWYILRLTGGGGNRD